MRILIADDDPGSLEALKTVLGSWEPDIHVCTDGVKAWEVLQSRDAPRLAVLDWGMPGMEGVELCRRVRAMPHSAHIYILLVTARRRREDIVAGLEAGADDYITKPFDRQELLARARVGMRMVELQEKLLESERMHVLAETAVAAQHEINQPLTVLLGLSELMLKQTPDGDPRRRHMAQVCEAGRRISTIVKKISAVRRYATRPYVGDVTMIDFEEGAGA